MRIRTWERIRIERLDGFFRLIPPLVSGVLSLEGISLISDEGLRNAEGGWSRGVIVTAAGVFLGLVIALLLAQRRKFRLELLAADGEYYEYDGQRIRAYFDKRDAMWLAADDLVIVLGARHSDVPRLLRGFSAAELSISHRLHLLSEAGVLRLLEKRHGRAIALLRRYLLQEVFAVHQRRREMGTLHYKAGTTAQNHGDKA